MFITFKLKTLLYALLAVVFIVVILVLIFSAGRSDSPRRAASAEITTLESVPATMTPGTSATGEPVLPRVGMYTLIIDAGHGGEDGGCSSATQVEAEINLDIALRMQALAGLYGVEPVMTRESAEIAYPASAGSISARKVWDQKQRVELINSIPNALLISIHQNTYPGAAPRGAQVLYAKTGGSEELAKHMQDALIASLDPENRRVSAPISDKIYLMKTVGCPAVLVECGFLSNPAEDALLATAEYRLKIAAVLWNAYLQAAG